MSSLPSVNRRSPVSAQEEVELQWFPGRDRDTVSPRPLVVVMTPGSAFKGEGEHPVPAPATTGASHIPPPTSIQVSYTTIPTTTTSSSYTTFSPPPSARPEEEEEEEEPLQLTALIDGSESTHQLIRDDFSAAPHSSSHHPTLGLMKSTHFPLLRSSPAVGTGSYGALPSPSAGEASSYGASSLSASTVSEDEDRAESDVDDNDNVGFLAPPRLRERAKRRANIKRSTLGDTKIQSKDGEAEGFEGDRLVGDTTGVESEDEEDEEDPFDNSPYPEVRASVPATDDLTLSINTPRMWTLSILFSLLGSSTNLFFSLRYPSISITPVIALLLAHPLGKLWDQAFPECDDDGSPAEKGKWGKLKRWLGQGRWNRKEHSCVYISSNVSFGFAFATDVIVEQTHFYHQDPGVIYQILLTLSTQILGYTFAGLTRQWLVYPASMIWPGTLMSTAMFTTLHGEENKAANGWRISRWKFFIIVFLCGFLWYFVPGLLMPALSYFNVLTWFAPKNVVVANLFGVTSGLGLFPLTFDWAQISYIGSPLMTPFWAAANVIAGLVVVMWVLAPLMYYANVMYSAYLPILGSAVFDNTGNPYNVSKILTEDYRFDERAYEGYSRVFMPITYVLSYGLQFAALTALVSHTICWHGKDIWRQWGRVRREHSANQNASTSTAYAPIPSGSSTPGTPGRKRRRHRRRSSLSESEYNDLVDREDVHMRLMRRYEEAPASWYLITFITMIAVGIFVVEYYPVYLPWYGLLLALGVCGVFFVPIGIVMAITNQQSSLFLVCQLICGTIFPGRPVANMVFVTYGYITSTQGLKFASDLKLGHYMKIPPRLLFSVQMVATLISSLTQIGVLNWMFLHIPNICTPEALNGFTCPIARVHFNGSILWGVVGPGRFFGASELYRPLIWAFAFGAVAPIIVWLIWKRLGGRRGRAAWLRRVSLPVVFGSLSWIPPATGLNFSSWAIICYIFNHILKRRAGAWWGKYTMTLSAALDASLAFGLVVVFFGFVYPGWMDGFRWWGTEVFKQGCDWKACSWLDAKKEEGGRFGPEKW